MTLYGIRSGAGFWYQAPNAWVMNMSCAEMYRSETDAAKALAELKKKVPALVAITHFIPVDDLVFTGDE